MISPDVNAEARIGFYGRTGIKKGRKRTSPFQQADNLLAHETLEGEQVEEIVGDWLG